jgi:hypothetical protein
MTDDSQYQELCANGCGTVLGIDVSIQCLCKNQGTEQEENETWCSDCFYDLRQELEAEGWSRDEETDDEDEDDDE